MSASAISSLSSHQKLDLYFGVRHHDLRRLGQALENGDLASAQQDYTTIQNLGQHGPFAKGNAFLDSNRQQDFEAIGSALQSGDLAGARQAFEQLRSTFAVIDPASAQQANPAVSDGAAADNATGTSFSVSG